MAAFAFNIATGRVVELFSRGPGGVLLLLEQAEPEAVLRRYDSLAALLAAPGNVECQDASYGRKTGLAAIVSLSDALEETDLSLPDQTFTALGGNSIAKAILAYQAGIGDAGAVPLTCHDWAFQPQGVDETLRFP